MKVIKKKTCKINLDGKEQELLAGAITKSLHHLGLEHLIFSEKETNFLLSLCFELEEFKIIGRE